MKGRIIKSTVVIVSAVILTTFGIDAADTLQKRGGTLLSQAINAGSQSGCPSGTVLLTILDKNVCVDQFESVPGPECPYPSVGSTIDTRSNLEDPQCVPETKNGARPWTYVTFRQAYELCARAGKRLPSSHEWYFIAIGTPDSISTPVCNINGGSLREGDESSYCKNGNGIYDAIGNAWEWIDGEVTDGVFEGRPLPPSGYVLSLDRHGVAEQTSPVPSDEYYRDYFWSEGQGEFGILRGGFYGSGDDAGLFSIQAKTALTFASDAIGFRCVDDIL